MAKKSFKMGYSLEKGVPVPPRMYGNRAAKYPWADMKKGMSFFVPKEGREIERVQSTLISGANNRQYQVVTRRVTEKGKTGVRVWRVA